MQVKAPTIGLFVTAFAGVVFWGVTGTSLLNDAMRYSRGGLSDYQIVLFLIGAIAVLAVAAVMVVGAVKMRRLQGYEWCMAAAILALIPWDRHGLFVWGGHWGMDIENIAPSGEVKDAFLSRSLHDD